MKIMPVMINSYQPQFTAKKKDDLRKMLGDALSDKLGGGLLEDDAFTPSTPSQPIIIDKLEIHNNPSSKKNRLADTATGLGVGGAGGAGISKISGKGNKSSGQEQNINYDKIADDAARDTNSGLVDDSERGVDIEEDINSDAVFDGEDDDIDDIDDGE